MAPENGARDWEQMLLGELRGLRTEFNSRLDRLVTTEAFAAEQRRRDDKEAALGREIAQERTTRETHEAEARSRQDKTANNIRWLAAAIVLPIALFVTNLVLAKGGA